MPWIPTLLCLHSSLTLGATAVRGATLTRSVPCCAGSLALAMAQTYLLLLGFVKPCLKPQKLGMALTRSCELLLASSGFARE